MNIIFGSGFLLDNGPDHMPQHTTGDIAVGKDLGDRLSLRFSALNVTDALFLTGFENAFAGTHYSNPRRGVGAGALPVPLLIRAVGELVS